jgi:hypothetical protein
MEDSVLEKITHPAIKKVKQLTLRSSRNNFFKRGSNPQPIHQKLDIIPDKFYRGYAQIPLQKICLI